MSSSPAPHQNYQPAAGKTPTKQLRAPLGSLDVNTNKAVTSQRDAVHDECERRLQSAQAEYAKKVQQMRQEFENAECEIEQWQQSYADIQEQGKQLHAAYEIKCIKVKELGGQLEEAKVRARPSLFSQRLHIHPQQGCSRAVRLHLLANERRVIAGTTNYRRQRGCAQRA